MKGTGSLQFPRRPGGPARPQNATPPAPVIENNTAGPITVTIESNDGKNGVRNGNRYA